MTTHKEYEANVARGLENMTGVSFGVCPGCESCAESLGYDSVDDLDSAYESGDTCDEGSFSWSDCGICGQSLGGDRHTWHWIDESDPDRAIHHESDGCSDCLFYLSNGDLPDGMHAYCETPSTEGRMSDCQDQGLGDDDWCDGCANHYGTESAGE